MPIKYQEIELEVSTMQDFGCPDCKTLWRDYAAAVTKYTSLESQQAKAASAGYLALFKDLTTQLHEAELRRNHCRSQITHHEQGHGGMRAAAAF